MIDPISGINNNKFGGERGDGTGKYNQKNQPYSRQPTTFDQKDTLPNFPM